MNDQQLAAVKQALELMHNRGDVGVDEWIAAEAAIKQAIAQDALDKMAENARALGPDYEPAPVQGLPFGVGGGLVAIKTLLGRDPCVHANTAIEMIDAILKEHPAAQPAVQEGRDWSLLEATQESLREHMAEIKRLKAAQPAPVKTYHDFEPLPVAPVPDGPYSAPIKELWPVAPKPWVGLSDEELNELTAIHSGLPLYRAIEAKLRSKNHG